MKSFIIFPLLIGLLVWGWQRSESTIPEEQETNGIDQVFVSLPKINEEKNGTLKAFEKKSENEIQMYKFKDVYEEDEHESEYAEVEYVDSEKGHVHVNAEGGHEFCNVDHTLLDAQKKAQVSAAVDVLEDLDDRFKLEDMTEAERQEYCKRVKEAYQNENMELIHLAD